MHTIKNSFTAVSIGKKLKTGPKLSLLPLLNKEKRIRSLRLLVFLIQILYIYIYRHPP